MSTADITGFGGVKLTVPTLPANDGTALPVTVASLPLPAGAATAAGVQATASADDIAVITPSDTVALTTIPKALYVTATGNLALKGTSGVSVTIPVVAGQYVLLRARYVMATGTSASVVALI